MAVKIFIKRLVPQDKARAMIPLFRQMRASATTQSGYITGETLRSLDKPDEFMVISTWQSSEDWKKWLHSKERTAVNDQIDQLSREKAEYAIYEPLVGGIIPASNIRGEK